MNLRLIRAFCAVYEAGSISKAAGQLGVAQPNISVSIRNLEFDLRTKLFERGSGGSTPTSVAHTYYARLQHALADLESAHRDLADDQASVGGPLRVGFSRFLSEMLVPELLPNLLANNSELELRLVEAMSEDLVEMTAAGELDVAVLRTAPLDPRLVSDWLCAEPFVMVSSSTNDRIPKTRLDLTKSPPLNIAFPIGPGAFLTILDQYMVSGAISASKVIGLPSLRPILDLVKNSDWMSILPISAVIGHFDSVTVREIDFPKLHSAECFTVRPASKTRTAAVDLFYRELQHLLHRNERLWQDFLTANREEEAEALRGRDVNRQTPKYAVVEDQRSEL